MRYGKLEGVDKPLSRLIQGTLMLARVSEEQAFELLDAVYEAGCRAFDTAPVYGRGLAEQRLGAWRARTRPSDVVVIDKGGHPKAGRSRVTPDDIQRDLQQSLDDLAVDRIDLYLLHRDDPRVPVAELVDCLDEQVKKGRIDRFGASNWSHTRIEAANRYAEREKKLGFVASSPEFNLLVPVKSWSGCLSIAGTPGAEARAWYARTQLPVMAWSPLAGGFLTGAYSEQTSASSDRERRVLEFYASADNFARLARLRELAKLKDKSPSSIALAYLMSSEMNGYATLGCRSKREFSECLSALDIELLPSDRGWLESGVRA